MIKNIINNLILNNISKDFSTPIFDTTVENINIFNKRKELRTKKLSKKITNKPTKI